MSLAIQINQHGGPDELKLVDVKVGEPGRGELWDPVSDQLAHFG